MKLSISMTRRESLLGWSYLMISIFVMPFALALLNMFLQNSLSSTDINLVFFGINFIATTVIFRKFLHASLLEAKENLWKCLKYALLGFLIYHAGTLAFAAVAQLLYPDFSNANDQSLMDLFQEHPALMSLCTIFFTPVSEELLYRGLLFQGLQRKNRILAYCVSVGVFSAIHVIGYVGRYDLLTLALMFLQYLPGGITLAWAYERSDTIVTPILMHITINQIGVAALR